MIQRDALVRSTGSTHQKSVRRSTYEYYGKLRMVARRVTPTLPQLTSPIGGAGARDEREGGGVFLGLIARVQVFWADLRGRIAGESGAVATEYVLLLIFVAVAIVAAATFFGIALGDGYKEACAPLNGGATC